MLVSTSQYSNKRASLAVAKSSGSPVSTLSCALSSISLDRSLPASATSNGLSTVLVQLEVHLDVWSTMATPLPLMNTCVFYVPDHTVSILHCPSDPALIRSDNTVRNEISTIGLQSLSSYSKGLLKHSAALSLALSLCFSLFYFSYFPLPLLLRRPDFPSTFLSRLPSTSALLCPLLFRLFIFCAGETGASMPHAASPVARCTATLPLPDYFFPSEINKKKILSFSAPSVGRK